MAILSKAWSALTGSRPWSVLVATGLGIGGYLFAVVLFAIVGASLLAAGIPVASPKQGELRILLSTVLGQGVAFGLFALVYLQRTGRGLSYVKARLPTLSDVGWSVGGFVLFYVGLIAVSLVVRTLGVQTAESSLFNMGQNDPNVFLVLIPLSFLLIGPGEELLYRGVVQERLREAFGRWPAILIASLIFASIHVFSIVGSFGQRVAYLGILFVLAPVLGAAYEYTRNLVVPALIHGAFNATQFAVAYLTVTGQIPAQ